MDGEKMNNNGKPLVSVITPVYNGASYLRECIESVLAQTYSNWEYIIVNNYSTDDTLKIAEEYARKDNRIRIFSNDKLLDIIANHNRAFRLISPDSKYCKIVSADDWIFPECLTQMISIAEANPSVGIVGSYQLSGVATQWSSWRVRWTELPYPSVVVKGSQVCRTQWLEDVYVFGTPTSLLYRSDIVRAEECFYPNSTAEADTSACYKYLQNTDFGFVHQVLSYERVHGQAMSTVCRSLYTYGSSRLSDLIQYGPRFLTPAEMESCISERLTGYYAFLAASVFHFRDKEFWIYHRRRLKEIGLPLSTFRLGRAVCAKIFDLVFNPKKTIEAILNGRQGRSSALNGSSRDTRANMLVLMD